MKSQKHYQSINQTPPADAVDNHAEQKKEIRLTI